MTSGPVPTKEELKTKVWGTHEDDLRSEKVDNGARRKDEWWTYWYTLEENVQVCGAYVSGGKIGRREQNRGRRCSRATGLRINGRCRKHSGGSGLVPNEGVVKGIKTGKFAADPLRVARARAKADDGNIYDLRPTLALFDQQMENISAAMEANSGTPDQWERAQNEAKMLKSAYDDCSDQEVESHIANLLEILTSGTDNHDAWVKILMSAERRSKRTEKAQELVIKSAEMIGRNELLIVLGRIINVIKEEARGTLQQTILNRLDTEVLGRVAPEKLPDQLADESRVLSGVPGEGVGVREGHPGGELLGSPTLDLRAVVREEKVHSEDVPRDREDAGGGGGRDDVPDDPEGLGSGDDSADGSPSPEPAVGGDRKAPRERKRRPTGKP